MEICQALSTGSVTSGSTCANSAKGPGCRSVSSPPSPGSATRTSARWSAACVNPSAEVLQQIAKGLRISAEALYIKAGILDSSDRPDVESAIAADPHLVDRQRRVLLDIYASFRSENARAAELVNQAAADAAGRSRPAKKAAPRKTAAKKAGNTAKKAGNTAKKAGNSAKKAAVKAAAGPGVARQAVARKAVARKAAAAAAAPTSSPSPTSGPSPTATSPIDG